MNFTLVESVTESNFFKTLNLRACWKFEGMLKFFSLNNNKSVRKIDHRVYWISMSKITLNCTVKLHFKKFFFSFFYKYYSNALLICCKQEWYTDAL